MAGADKVITDPELLGFARQALNMARTDFELTGWKSSFLLASYHRRDQGMHRMRKIEAMLTGMLGEDWLNDGRKKDHAFLVIRFATKMRPPDVMVFCTATNMFRPSEKAKAASPEMQKKLWERSQRGHDEDHRMAAEGWFTITDSFTATAQTPERICICVQEVHRGQFVGQPQVIQDDMAHFRGRLKMFGLSEEEEAAMQGMAERFLRSMQKGIA